MDGYKYHDMKLRKAMKKYRWFQHMFLFYFFFNYALLSYINLMFYKRCCYEITNGLLLSLDPIGDDSFFSSSDQT